MGNGFKELRVWKQAMALAKEVYLFVEHLPREERWNLADQLRRCAISVPSNIAEGQATGADGMFLRHLRIAQGSLAEMETQLLLAKELDLTAIDVPEVIWEQIGELRRALFGLRDYLESRCQK